VRVISHVAATLGGCFGGILKVTIFFSRFLAIYYLGKAGLEVLDTTYPTISNWLRKLLKQVYKFSEKIYDGVIEQIGKLLTFIGIDPKNLDILSPKISVGGVESISLHAWNWLISASMTLATGYFRGTMTLLGVVVAAAVARQAANQFILPCLPLAHKIIALISEDHVESCDFCN
jgi:hypothetical protein